MRSSPFHLRAPQLGRVICDANAWIYHPASAEHWQLLNNPNADPDEVRAIFQEIRPDLVAFYENWISVLEACQGSIFVSSAVFDCELSGGRFAGDRMERYRRRAAPKPPPRGDIVRPYDSRSTTSLKNRLLRVLHEQCRISDRLQLEAKGLRYWIRDGLLKKPIWRQAAKDAGLSWVDEDLLVNALAASALGPTTVMTNDKAIHRMARSLRNGLKQASWYGGKASDEQRRWAEAIAARPFDTAQWKREAGELWILEAV